MRGMTMVSRLHRFALTGILPPGLRNLALTAHVATSVGWLGAVAVFLALAITGLVSADSQVVRSVYIAMEVTTRYVIVPLAFASLLTGLFQSLGTTWGLFRHYWVLAKLLLTVLATLLLLLHTRPISAVANMARETTVSGAAVARLQAQLVGDAGAAILVLLIATTLSVYKPRGLTPYGWRRQQAERAWLARRLIVAAHQPVNSRHSVDPQVTLSQGQDTVLRNSPVGHRRGQPAR